MAVSGPVVAVVALEGVRLGVVARANRPVGRLGGILDGKKFPVSLVGDSAVLLAGANEHVASRVELGLDILQTLGDATRPREEVLSDSMFPREIRHNIRRLLADYANVLGPATCVVENGVRVRERLECRQFER